jgi:hypothetical protein
MTEPDAVAAARKAHHALLAAARAAPEEVRTRPTVHRLVADLHRRAPATIQRDIRQFAARVGAAL